MGTVLGKKNRQLLIFSPYHDSFDYCRKYDTHSEIRGRKTFPCSTGGCVTNFFCAFAFNLRLRLYLLYSSRDVGRYSSRYNPY